MNKYEIEFLVDDRLSPSELNNKEVIEIMAENMDAAETRALKIVLELHPKSMPMFWGGRLVK